VLKDKVKDNFANRQREEYWWMWAASAHYISLLFLFKNHGTPRMLTVTSSNWLLNTAWVPPLVRGVLEMAIYLGWGSTGPVRWRQAAQMWLHHYWCFCKVLLAWKQS